jgi:magnesium transporter
MYKSTKAAGAPPGSLVFIGEQRSEKVRLTLYNYDAGSLEEKTLETPEEAFPFRETKSVSWLNIDGVHNVDVIRSVGEGFEIHPLVLEDVLNTAQRPKMENYQDYLYLVVKMIHGRGDSGAFDFEQVSIILGPKFVLSFQEREGDVFEVVRQRLETADSRLRQHGPDYLVYRLLDTIVDNYFTVLEKLGDRIEILEERLMHEATKKMLTEIHQLKREMILLRKSIWPLRELVSNFQREENPLITDMTNTYLRDVYDHIIQIIDTVESFREMVSSLLDIYLSSVSNRMNEIMKTLTIIASIFIPLTFIAGIYGMNFDSQAGPWNMPELHWALGYPVAIGVMLVIALCMVYYFRKKDWL